MSSKNLILFLVVLPKLFKITSGVLIDEAGVNLRIRKDSFVLKTACNFPVIKKAKTDGIFRAIESATHAKGAPFSHFYFSIFVDESGGRAFFDAPQTLGTFLHINPYKRPIDRRGNPFNS